MADFNDALIAFGRGVNSSQNQTPSAIQEYTYYMNLPPAERDNYLKVKRAQQVFNQGDQFGLLSPATNTVAPIAPINLKPEDQPKNAADKTTAVDTAKNQTDKAFKFKVDQNLMNNADASIQKQIDAVNNLFDERGNLKPAVAANYGSVMGQQLPVVHQDTADARALLNNVNAQSFIKAVGDMKSQSSTGASGLGALSEKEGDKVQAAASSAADTKQSPESAATNLKTYRDELLSSQKRLKGGFENLYGEFLGGQQNSSNQPDILERKTIGDKSYYRTKDGWFE